MAKPMFRGLTGGDDDPKEKLKKLVSGVNKGVPINIEMPDAPSTAIQPHPMEAAPNPPSWDAVPAAAPAANYAGEGSAYGGPGAELAQTAQHNQMFRGLAPQQAALVDPTQGGNGDMGANPGLGWSPEMERQQAAANNQYATSAALEHANQISAGGQMDAQGGGDGPGRTLPAAVEPEPPGSRYAPQAGGAGYNNGQPQSSADFYNQIQQTESGARDNELGIHHRGLASRLFRGLGRGWKNWDAKDGLYGLFDTIGEGVESAASGKHDIEAQRQGKEQQLFRGLGMAQRYEDFQNKQAATQMQAANYGSQIQSRNVGAALDIAKADHDRLTAQQKNLIDIWKDSPTYRRGENKTLDQQIDAAKLVLPDKEQQGQYSGSYAPDGTFNVLNTRTGVSEERGHYAKPTSISANDLPDELFGLPSDKELSDQAQAQVGKLPEGRKLREDVSNRLAAAKPEKYLKPDGTFNEDQYWADRASGRVDVSPSDLYENLPSNYEQQTAAARNALSDKYKGTRAEVAKFRTALTNHTPGSDAVAVPLTRIVDDYKKVLGVKDPKARAKALDAYYREVLPHIKVGG